MSTTITAINVGTAPNDNTGDPLRNGGQIINENTTKLFNLSNKIDEGKMHVFKYTGNVDISIIQQNDIVTGIIVVSGTTYFIKAQYNTGDTSIFGTEANDFNDGSYKTFEYTNLT